MSLFGKKKAGGLMDEIRCDESSYLIWKWHPINSQLNNNNRENAIRWGSSLRVKDGEVAVFVHKNKEEDIQEFIEGPFDKVLETENLPIIASIVGLAYEGGTPFQAEVYFINLAKIIQVSFGVPYFDIFDPRFLDFGVPVAVRGRISFNISDYKHFIELHRLINFNLSDFQGQIQDAVIRYVKSVVINVPSEKKIPIIQIESQISEINSLVEKDIKTRLFDDFGVSVTAVDIKDIELDKTSEGYARLRQVTQDITSATVKAQSEVNIKNMNDTQRINAENMEESLRIQREEAQYAQRKQTEMSNFAAYQLEKQAEVGIAGAEALGQMGVNGGTEMSGGSMNPAGMMAGMAMGGAIGQNMAGMMNGMMQGVNNIDGMPQSQMGTPPPVPQAMYYVVVNGESTGPYEMGILKQMVIAGSLSEESLVWKTGMTDWAKAKDVQELNSIFVREGATNENVPPIPPSVNDSKE